MQRAPRAVASCRYLEYPHGTYIYYSRVVVVDMGGRPLQAEIEKQSTEECSGLQRQAAGRRAASLVRDSCTTYTCSR
jgi:hypothetical protein